ncbi:MAG: rRNA maturation RNase YbeY, partial [Desulfobulbaceae bacterium]|nr:rRNA maturation RNase YbeY [Desulfobulbaceae bacterium]
MLVTLTRSESVGQPILTDLLRRRLELLMRTQGVPGSSVSLVLLDDDEMAQYNEQYRQRIGPTNVLSFPADMPLELMGGEGGVELGDILVSVDTAAREAAELGVSLHDRLTRLIIHGFLHLLGHDHERSEEEALFMWDKEEEIFNDMKKSRRETMIQLAINVDHVA